MIGTAEIYKALVANAGIQALVSKTGTAPNYVYKIQSAVREPDSWLISDTTCIVYQSGPDNNAEIYNVNHTVNCRAPTESGAKTLARAVVAALHRVTFEGVMFYCTIEQVIPPADNTDNFNAPVTVQVVGTK